MALRSGDVFAPMTECAPLVHSLRERISREGRITFQEFMEAALYDSQHGYYITHRDAATRRGDFVTSPELHPVFGALVAKQIRQTWDLMGQPAHFDVVELGGGRGTLGRQINEWARSDPEFAEAIQYRIVERNHAAGNPEQPDSVPDIDWIESLPDGINGCVLSNEFFDALPVHRVKRMSDRMFEVYVTVRDGCFAEILDFPSTREIEEHFERVGVLPAAGCFAEVNLAAERWMHDIAARLVRGYVLTFDYGDESSGLYAPWRRDGTLRCFYRQSMSSGPYQRIGMQDMTSSVDFTTLRYAGEGAGLRTAGFTDQSRFLMRLGLGHGLTAVVREGAPDMEEYFARRNVVLELIDPARLGRVKVLAQGKDVPTSPLAGFDDDE